MTSSTATAVSGKIEQMRTGNLKEAIPNELSGELFTELASGPGARVERIVSRGHASPEGFWYDQEDAELVIVVEGGAVLEVEDDSASGPARITLGPGDWCEIAAHVRHRVAWTDPDRDTIWIAVFYRAR